MVQHIGKHLPQLLAFILLLAQAFCEPDGELGALLPMAPRELAMRDVAGCPAGFTNCDLFGCIEGTSCPETCDARQNVSTCPVNVNGNGCKWTYDTCVQDIQCSVNATGACSEGCRGCGEFLCIIEQLTCPTACSLRSKSQCNTAEFYNGLGCSWIGNECVTWNFITNAPLAGNIVQPTDGQVTTATVTVDIVDVVTISQSSTSTSTSSTTSTTTSTTTSHSSMSRQSIYWASTTHKSSSEEPTSSEPTSSEPSSSESSSSAKPSESPSDDGLGGIDEKPKGMSVGVIVVIVLVVLGLIGLISWIALYRITKNKGGGVSPRVYTQPGLMPANDLPMFNNYD
ncbi:hypothetical protein LPJ59_000304 [Coemansia sp. RSA 2399]|nr:hypothetical protein LPJ59_000304 [Coemansia sp. RSA 2399]KAJ1908347.1 hypothetical protein LPJ81_000138 [Coemansia sp. IMI 209127]